MPFGATLQKPKKKPAAAATTTVAEEAVVEEAPEGYAAEIEKKKELLADRHSASEQEGSGFQTKYEARRKLDAVLVGPNRPELPSGPSPLPLGAGKFGMLDDRRPVEPELAESILTLPAYPEEPSGEAAVTPETASEVYLRRLSRPAEEVALRGGAIAGKRGVRSLGLMDFGTLNQTYDHMSIPLLNAYMDHLLIREQELKELIAAEVGAGAIEGQAAGKVYKEQKEADKGLPYAQNYKPDILNWVQRSLKQARATRDQMERIKQALEAEAKSDKK